MKRFFLITALLFGTHLQAQTGDAAVANTETATSGWQSWTFVATAIVTAATAVFVVSLDSGQHAH